MTERDNNHRHNELLSALVDNELSELELHRVLKAVEEDSSVRDTWARYQMAGAVMRGERDAASPVDIASGVRSLLADEPALALADSSDSEKSAKVGLWGNLGRFAVAASVATLAVFGVQQLQTVGVTEQVATSAPAPSGPVSDLPMGLLAPDFPAVRNVSAGDLSSASNQKREAQPPVLLIPVKGAAPSQELQTYLNSLMLEHAEHTANTSTGMLPFARIPRIEQALESARLNSDNAAQESQAVPAPVSE